MKKIINEILRKRVKAIDFNYKENFEKAFVTSTRFGLKKLEFQSDGNFHFDRELILAFIDKHIFKKPISEIALKCFPICRELSEKLYSELGILAVPTLGYLITKNYQGQTIKKFYEHKYFLKKRIDKDDNFSINLHCWLTFPNFYILDPTIKSTEIFVKGEFEKNYKLSFLVDGLQQNENSTYCYQPVLLGCEYYDRLKIKGTLNSIEY